MSLTLFTGEIKPEIELMAWPVKPKSLSYLFGSESADGVHTVRSHADPAALSDRLSLY